MQEVVEGDRGDDGATEQKHDALRPALHDNLLVLHGGGFVLHRPRHEKRGNDVVHDRRYEQGKERPEVYESALPDHQGRDVSKGTEGAARVRRYHDIDAGDADKARVAAPDGQHHGTHHQRRGQVVDDRGQEEADDASDPEELAEAETSAHEPGAQRVEDPPLAHRVDVGHRAQQEQEEFGELDQEMSDGLVGFALDTADCILGGDDRPDHTRREDDRHRFSKVREFLDDDERVRHDEYHDSRDSDPMSREIHIASLQSGTDRVTPAAHARGQSTRVLYEQVCQTRTVSATTHWCLVLLKGALAATTAYSVAVISPSLRVSSLFSR